MELSQQEFRDIQTLVRSLCGLVLSDHKTYLVRTRLESVVQGHGLVTFTDYLGRLQQLGAVLMREELVEALTTRETSFNRDTHPFEEFRRLILPALADTIGRRRESCNPTPIARIWSAGCSTGQEAYSLAMAVHHFVGGSPALHLRPDQFPILATDVSIKAITLAKEGRYSERDLDRGLSQEWRTRYFRKGGDVWVANNELRRSIEFRRLNFIGHTITLGPFDVIFCRNVMIYFDVPTRQRLCDQFHQQLNTGGLLILGAAESLCGLKTPLVSEQIGGTWAYRKAIDSRSAD